MLAPPNNMQPSREEIEAYAREVAARNGIDANTFLMVIDKESGMNPAAVGDQGQSFGLAQLYMGGGLGNVYEQQFGKRPDNAGDWKQHLDFMGQQVAQGGQGYGPWHAAKNNGIGQFEGVPGHEGQNPQATGRRGRAGEVAQSAAPMNRTREQQMASGGDAPFDWQKWREQYDPDYQKHGTPTLGALVANKLYNATHDGPRREDMLNKDTSHTLIGALFGGPPKDENPIKSEKDQIAQDLLDKYNDMSPIPKDEQVAQLMAKKKRGLGPGLYAMFGGTPQNPAQPQRTVGSSFLKGVSSLFG